jgi:hypothetical protein
MFNTERYFFKEHFTYEFEEHEDEEYEYEFHTDKFEELETLAVEEIIAKYVNYSPWPPGKTESSTSPSPRTSGWKSWRHSPWRRSSPST